MDSLVSNDVTAKKKDDQMALTTCLHYVHK